MAKLKSERIVVRERDDNGHELYKNIALDFKIDINVAKDGSFTTTLPEDVVVKLIDAGIGVSTNGRSNGKKGFFEAGTLPDLMKAVRSVAEEFVSKEIVSEKIIIKYIIETVCRYGKKGDEYAPYSSYYGEGKGYEEKTGSMDIYSQQPGTFGFRVWTQCLNEKIYSYKSGQQRVFYDTVSGSHDVDEDKRPMLHYLSSIYCQKQAKGEVRQIDYTESTAEFFVNLYKAIFKINDRVKDFTTPEAIQKIIDSKQLLLS